MRIAALQMNSSAEPKANLSQVAKAAERAAADGVGLLVLPENFSGMGLNPAQRLQQAEAFGTGPVQDGIAELAQRHNLWIVAGSLPLLGEDPSNTVGKTTGRVYAASLVYSPQGRCVARYNKLHLFDVQVGEHERYAESDSFMAGNQAVLLRTPFAVIGLSICYDLRFPLLFQRLRDAGMELLVLPSAFTAVTGKAHWQALLRARAIENQCYVVAPNQVGEHADGRSTWGHSLIINASGKVLADAGNSPKLISADYDAALLRQQRQQMPVQRHQRLDFSIEEIDAS